MDEWVRRLLAFKDEHGLWREGDCIVAAVSGGPDSMVMLHLLHTVSDTERLQLVAAHVDHGFRGQESANESTLVRTFAAKLGVPFESVTLDMPSYIEATGMNSQQASRMKRYEFLHAVAARHGASHIALAHHADDQAETVLMRLLRGTGTGGLAGIPVKRRDKNVELIRPLLRINKAELAAYADLHSIPYAIDSSNEKRDYWRNELRLDVLPYLEQHNPQLSSSLNRLAEIASAEDQWMQDETRRAFDRLAARSLGSFCELQRADLASLPLALQRRLIKLILNYLSMETAGLTPGDKADFERIEAIRHAALATSPTTWQTDAGGGIRFYREYDRLRWWIGEPHSRKSSWPPYAYTIEAMDDVLDVPEGGLSFRLTNAVTAADERGRYGADFDADQLLFPLTVRNRRPGDRMSVVGLNGTKKVQDMFVDLKIPPSERDRMPLLVDAAGQVLWIPGARRSAIALTDAGTTNVLRIQAVPSTTNIE
ncbi:tRNA lysidine(34) synthetase TilS [Paenibacillus sp. PR3]|uniref:tRNA(Ile)-lysidine synthase n=1 Tax=Paenibacillus terricola TaxID=2763503 RepID=A0ABR8N6F2_9BACL|nr:tRNA lysidine(34) synthetase TilS [Paenibacillus terricola]MBD3922770.1 tRNA lysidine(34) synthetase TilS [Paenibacillus terricola]